MFHFNLPGSLFSISAAAGLGALDRLAVRLNTTTFSTIKSSYL
jgi:hypothetical protein